MPVCYNDKNDFGENFTVNKHYFYIILAAVFWGSMGIFVNSLSEFGLSTVQICLLRSVASLLLMGLLILVKDRSLFRIRLRDIWMFLGTGIVSYFLFNNCYFIAIRQVGVAVASVLLYTSPIFVTLMSCLFFGEKLTGKKLVCLVLAVGGCALVSGLASGSGTEVSPVGILIGLASGFTYALYSIFSTFALKRYRPLTVTFYTFLFGGLACLLVADPASSVQAVATPVGLLWVLGLGIITGAAPYFLYTKGLSGVQPSHAAVIATAEPVVASLIGIFLYREQADLFTLLGIVMILGASILLNVENDK